MAPPRTVVTTSCCSLLLIHRPRKDERLSWLGWLTCSGRFTYISGHPSAVGRSQDSESSPVKDRVLPLSHGTNHRVRVTQTDGQTDRHLSTAQSAVRRMLSRNNDTEPYSEGPLRRSDIPVGRGLGLELGLGRVGVRVRVRSSTIADYYWCTISTACCSDSHSE